jgi:hypothetical protein
MGYRSDVAYTIRFVSDDDTKNRQSFYTFLAEAKSKAAIAGCFNAHWNEVEVDEVRLRINFTADNVKWYEDYADVQCHEALINLANEWVNDELNNSEIAYKFVRVGEEVEDVESRTGGTAEWDWVHVGRSIERDW